MTFSATILCLLINNMNLSWYLSYLGVSARQLTIGIIMLVLIWFCGRIYFFLSNNGFNAFKVIQEIVLFFATKFLEKFLWRSDQKFCEKYYKLKYFSYFWIQIEKRVYSLLFFAILCYSVLFCAILCYSVPFLYYYFCAKTYRKYRQ